MSAPERDPTLPPIGFLAVEVNIHRPAGDPFNEKTWPFPLIRETVSGSTVPQLVTDCEYDEDFIDRFVAAGKKLAERGAVGLFTSCGFLAMAQPRLAARLPIPIATSSLIQIPSIIAFLPAGATVGVVTYDGGKLNAGHLEKLGINPARVHIRGAPEGGILREHMVGRGPYDTPKLEAELVEAAKVLVAEHPEIGAIVLECTQMPPYGKAIQEAVGLPVYDVFTMGQWFYSGVVRRRPTFWGPAE